MASQHASFMCHMDFTNFVIVCFEAAISYIYSYIVVFDLKLSFYSTPCSAVINIVQTLIVMFV